MDSTLRVSLLKAARGAVAAHLAGLPSEPAPPDCGEAAGVFVSVYVRDELRGCTGVLDSRLAVGRTVVECAVSAATADPRFTPIEADDLLEVAFEIAVLDSPSPMGQPVALELGRHGIIVSSGSRRGLLLPRVAIDHAMSVDQFLDAACRKAALPPGAWRTPAVMVELFTAEVFGEGSPAAGRRA